jgi:hypothetical protein
MKKTLLFLTLLLSCLSLSVTALQADQRLFGYSYQADSIMPEGKWEIESVITRKPLSNNESKWYISQELEYGLTPRLTTALYLNSQITPETTEFKGISSEWKYMVLSPNVNPIGVMVYGELKMTADSYELEEKLILQHNIDDWILVSNIVLEQEFEVEDETNTKKGVLEVYGAAAYKFSPSFALGFEAKMKKVYADFGSESDAMNFFGPSFHYENEKWTTAITILSEIDSDLDLFENIYSRWVVGYSL